MNNKTTFANTKFILKVWKQICKRKELRKANEFLSPSLHIDRIVKNCSRIHIHINRDRTNKTITSNNCKSYIRNKTYDYISYIGKIYMKKWRLTNNRLIRLIQRLALLLKVTLFVIPLIKRILLENETFEENINDKKLIMYS